MITQSFLLCYNRFWALGPRCGLAPEARSNSNWNRQMVSRYFISAFGAFLDPSLVLLSVSLRYITSSLLFPPSSIFSFLDLFSIIQFLNLFHFFSLFFTFLIPDGSFLFLEFFPVYFYPRFPPPHNSYSSSYFSPLSSCLLLPFFSSLQLL